MAVVILNSFTELPNKDKELVCKKMERRIPTEICGPPPEVIPNIPIKRNRNEPFRLI